MVKWKGYPDATPEPLSSLTHQKIDQVFLDQIAQRQADYDLAHPKEARPVDTHPPPDPTRVLPSRERVKPHRFVFHVSQFIPASEHDTICHRFHALARESNMRAQAHKQLTPDFADKWLLDTATQKHLSAKFT